MAKASHPHQNRSIPCVSRLPTAQLKLVSPRQGDIMYILLGCLKNSQKILSEPMSSMYALQAPLALALLNGHRHCAGVRVLSAQSCLVRLPASPQPPAPALRPSLVPLLLLHRFPVPFSPICQQVDLRRREMQHIPPAKPKTLD